MDIKNLRDEYAKLHNECNAFLEKKSKAGETFTAEDKQEQEKRFARMDEIKALSEQYNRLADSAGIEFKSGNIKPEASKAEQEFTARNPEAEKFSERDAVNHFLRTGARDPRDKYTLISTSGSSIMLPKEVLPPVSVRRNVNAFRRAKALMNSKVITTTSTDQITLPVWDDTGNTGQAPSESSTTNTTADSTLTGSLTLNATLYESKTKWFSNTLLNANGFDILGYVAPILSKMLDKSQESAWTTVAKALTAGFTTAANNAFTYPDLINWEHTLSVAYRSDAVFVVSDALYKALRGLTDSNGRPILDLDPTNTFAKIEGDNTVFGLQSTIHGHPVVVSDYFDTLATTNKVGIFASAEAIVIRDVVPQRLTRYVNIPTFVDQTGFDLFANGDANFISSGVSLAVMHV